MIRVYSSPVLSAENLEAKGVASAATPFRTAFTLPAGVDELYVLTTLPDGRKTVTTTGAGSTVSVQGAALTAAIAPNTGLTTRASQTSSMPEFPRLDMPATGNMETITTSPSKTLELVADAYIPAGTTIEGNIHLNGNSNNQPVLYVAGTLTIPSLQIDYATLAVLPGGEVIVKDKLSASDAVKTRPAIYIFAGGKLSLKKANLSCRTVVNLGTIAFKESLNLNSALSFYNAVDAEITADELECTNTVRLYNDGRITVKEIMCNAQAEFQNCENGELVVNDFEMANSTNKFYQKGNASIDEMLCQGEFYVNCHTLIDEFKMEQGKLYVSAGACLETDEADLGRSQVEMAAGSLFIAKEYGEDKDEGNTFTSRAQAGDTLPVVLFLKKAHYSEGDGIWWGKALTTFSGLMEVVDPQAESKAYYEKLCFKNGAYLTAEQITNIPKSECNGGKGQITPDPEPEPEPFENRTGRTYTYCFEDNWPYLGDYDMNDIVVVSRVDRMVSKDGSMVSALTFNWELKAAGTTYDIACGVQMDKVQTSEVASVESSHKGFGSGPFSSTGLEAGNKYAVIPLFNDSKELLNGWNTWKGHPAATTQKHTVTVTFSQAVAADAVKDSELNFFIAAKSRSNEIHMPGYAPTASGLLGKGSFRPNDPYRFYVVDGDQVKNNYMMWALMIPGEFRYPCESKDIRGVYKHFLTWAASNGTEHEEWYREDVDEDCIY